MKIKKLASQNGRLIKF